MAPDDKSSIYFQNSHNFDGLEYVKIVDINLQTLRKFVDDLSNKKLQQLENNHLNTKFNHYLMLFKK